MIHSDNYDVDRFARAQDGAYQQALKEIKEGRKRSHWMWYIFPQVDGLGYSWFAQKYAIKNLEEAESYISHPKLKAHLNEISEALLLISTNNVDEVMPMPDDLKLKSSMTLFALVDASNPVYKKVLDKFYNGEMCEFTKNTVEKWQASR